MSILESARFQQRVEHKSLKCEACDFTAYFSDGINEIILLDSDRFAISSHIYFKYLRFDNKFIIIIASVATK